MKRIFLLVLLGSWLSAAQATLFGDDELLPVDKAFAMTTAVSDDNKVIASWEIAENYYLYRDKFQFHTETKGITLGEPVFPAGKMKHDEFFGEIETYRNQTRIEIPVIRGEGAPTEFELQSKYQGCADLGVCYPPQTKTVKLALADTTAVTAKAEPLVKPLKPPLDLGLNSGFGAEDELLPADEAFRIDVRVGDANSINAEWVIAEGYYLYRHRFEFALDPVDGVTLEPPQLPDGEHKTDEFFGEIQVYHQQASARLPLKRTNSAATPVHLTVKYQGCAEIGVCYPPITKEFDLLLPAVGAAAAVAEPPKIPAPPASATERVSEQDAIARHLKEGSLWGVLLGFFGFGLLLSFTPCVFPMIPILSSIIVGQGDTITTGKSFVLSLVYVLAMAVTYTVAGVFAGMSGENIQAAFQNPWILSSFAAVFVLLSLSMFGFYELQMPAFIQNRLTAVSNRQKGGSLIGVAIMGFLSALIVGPCVAAPLAGALIYIGQTGDPVLGGLALFALSMGMGVPLIAIGTGAGKLLPKAGPWMDAIKAVFGVLLIGLAIWMLERILPAQVILALWAVLLILSSIYLRALDPLPVEAGGWAHLWKGVGLLSLVSGVLMLVGAASGGSDPMQPLQHMFRGQAGASTATSQQHLAFGKISSVDELDRELDSARQQGKRVMLDFYADWCISCKEMEKYTFGDAGVQQALAGMVLLQADVTADSAADKALLKRFNLFGPPGIIFWDSTGKQRPGYTLVGYKPADEFITHLQGLE